MARQLRAEIGIEASPERVWEVLTDFAAYPRWNPFMVEAEGRAAPGQRLRVRMRLPGRRRPTTFRPQVLEAVPARRLRWLGRLVLPGLFDGEHSFELEPAGPGRSRLVQQERFRGLLARPLLAFLADSTLAGFHQMNQALKARAEHPSPDPGAAAPGHPDAEGTRRG
jgi:hypothetical protein